VNRDGFLRLLISRGQFQQVNRSIANRKPRFFKKISMLANSAILAGGVSFRLPVRLPPPRYLVPGPSTKVCIISVVSAGKQQHSSGRSSFIGRINYLWKMMTFCACERLRIST
jgi:hypothetical protein